MKIGTTARSLENPTAGFSIRREGFSIYAQFIPEDSITTMFVPNENGVDETDGHIEYEYKEYSFYDSFKSYEDLISRLVALKYTIEDEMSLVNKMIANEYIDEYTAYRSYVNECKTIAKLKYESLGLIRISI